MDDDAPRQIGFFGILWRLAFAGVFVAAICGAGGYFGVVYLVSTPEDEAPNLLTLDIDDAISRSSTAGFPIIVDGKEPSDLLAEGHVLSQRPAPGAIVKSGATVHVTLSSK